MRFPIRILSVPPKINFIGQRFIGFTLSGIIIFATIFLLATRGLNFGIDFSGGVVIEVRAHQAADIGKMRELLANPDFGEVTLQQFGDEHDVIIRVRAEDKDQAAVAAAVKSALDAGYGEALEYRKVDYVGPQVGKELVQESIIALTLALAGMMVYLWFRFEWQFGVGGMIALLHDAIATLGFFSLTQLEFNLTSVAAVLTIIGYSINDSVVIYDRVRETMRKYKKLPLSQIINISVNETLSRTILTGGSVLAVLVALAMYGGDVLYGFSVSLLFGVLIGTYSSIYVSANVLLYLGLRHEEKTANS